MPGYVVDSSTTSVPGCRLRATVAVAERTGPRSGPPSSDRGVGTQITIVCAPASSVSSVVARKPAARIAATSASDRSSTWETPELSPSTTAWFTSNPVTDRPARLASCASGSPT
ncbi:hypothetical protein CPER28S_00822 [Cellulomonas persica]